eukprot:6338478-Pyramimonas_sp.AAC.1
MLAIAAVRLGHGAPGAHAPDRNRGLSRRRRPKGLSASLGPRGSEASLGEKVIQPMRLAVIAKRIGPIGRM